MSKRPRDDAPPSFSAAELAALLASGEDVPSLDAAGVKRLLLRLERAISRNASLRAKHAAEPIKFLDSEVELHQALKALQALAAAPEHYPLLPKCGAVPTLLGLLGHENADIAVGVVELLGELLGEEDEEGPARESAELLLDALTEEGGAGLLLQGVARLGGGDGGAEDGGNAARDAEGLLAALSLLGRAVALRSGLVGELCGVQRGGGSGNGSAPHSQSLLLPLLFSQLRLRAFSDVKGACAELLCDLLSIGGLAAAAAVGGSMQLCVGAAAPASGVECLLEALAVFRKRAPSGGEEEECVGNLFNALCACLVRLLRFDDFA